MRSINHNDPITGPYYWIPTPNGWKLLSFPDTLYENNDHTHIWSSIVVTHLQDVWHLPRQITLVLSKYPYGVSRGRVSRGYPIITGVYYLNHGDDAPIPWDEVILIITKEFHLGRIQSRGKLKIVYDEHETMLSLHRFKVEKFISTRYSDKNV